MEMEEGGRYQCRHWESRILGERGGKGESLLIGIPSWRLVLLVVNDACIAASGHGLGCGRGGRRDGGIYTHNWSSRFHSCVKYLP